MLISILGHVSPCWYSDLLMYHCDSTQCHLLELTSSLIAMLLFSFVHVYSFWYSHFLKDHQVWYSDLVMFPHVDIHTWSCIDLLLNSVMFPYFAIHIWSWITVLILTLGHVSCFDTLLSSCVPVLIFTLVHGSPVDISLDYVAHINIHTWSCISVLIFSHHHKFPCGYSPLVMYTCIDFSFGHGYLCCYSHLFMYNHHAIFN